MRFVNRFDDLSSDERGFQFKFYCDACGAGRVSRLEPRESGGSLLRAAGEFLGDLVVPAVAPPPGQDETAGVGGPAREKALGRAADEAREHFRRCERCGRWVCAEACWDDDAGHCREDCAASATAQDDDERALALEVPSLKTGAGRAAATGDEGRAVADEVGHTSASRAQADEPASAPVVCAACGAEVGEAKFCPECGAPVHASESLACPACGRRPEGEPTFCPECGAKMSPGV